MKETRLLMGMPISIEIVDENTTLEEIEKLYAYFDAVDKTFSTYKDDSEISRINRGEIPENQYSSEMKEILTLSEATRMQTRGYFNIRRDNLLDPSGIVKGWAIYNAAQILVKDGFHNYYIDAGGDIQISGYKDGSPWFVGIRNPFNRNENIKILVLSNAGIATSGTAERGQHIYNPFQPDTPIQDIASITVIGPDVYEADRFATPAFAMGRDGIYFIEEQPYLEGYMIDSNGIATFTTGFERYVLHE